MGGLGAVVGVVLIHLGQGGAGDVLQQVGAVGLHAADLEAGVEVKGRGALIVQGSVVVDGVVDGLGGGAVLVHVYPIVNALNGQIAGQVGGKIVVEQAAAAGADVVVQVTGTQQVVGAAGHGTAVQALVGVGERHRGIIQLIPGGGHLQASLLQQVCAVPHDLGMGVIGNTVSNAVHGHIGQRLLREEVSADGIDCAIDGSQHVCVEHLHHLAGVLSSAHVGQVTGGDAGVPLGVEVAPGHSLDVDGHAGVVSHKLVGSRLDGLHTGALGEGVPESDLAGEFAGFAGGCVSRGVGFGRSASASTSCQKGDREGRCKGQRQQFFHIWDPPYLTF